MYLNLKQKTMKKTIISSIHHMLLLVTIMLFTGSAFAYTPPAAMPIIWMQQGGLDQTAHCHDYADYITNVTFAGINNTTAGSGAKAWHTDYGRTTPQVAIGQVTVGQTYPISITITGSDLAFEYLAVYVDWNQNGINGNGGTYVLEATENPNVWYGLTGSGSKTLTGNITVPAGATPGLLYLRVMLDSEVGNSTGGDFTCALGYGEIQDYVLNVSAAAVAPTVTTQAVSSIASTTATGNGNITSLGSPNPTAYGVCWNTSTNPTTSNSKTDNGAASATGIFTASMTSLSANTTYYVRAFATNTVGTSYGTEVSFTTSAIAPTVTTQAVSSITATTATGNGNITSLGVPNPTAYGVCWNTGGTPTIANSKTDKGAVSASGAFTASITSLTAYTTYYVRAFATNTAGTSYGTEVSFTTSAIAPTVTTQSFSIFTATTATANGNITALGVPNPTSYGVCWSTSDNPTTSDSKTDNGAASATGAFTAAMTNLTANTTYHVRAYAINAAGTSYGGEMVFTTEVAKTIWNGITWTPSTPTVLDSAIINADYNSTGFSCNNLTINSGFQVTFSSAVTVTHNLYVKSGATLINNGTLTVNGISAVQQDLTGAGNSVPTGRYWYVSSPVTGSTGWAFNSLGLDILKYYNEPSHAWSAVTDNATVLPVGRGYYCRLIQNETINFMGTLNSGTITVTPTRSGSSDAKRGFNLVGNPYPSYLNWDDVEKTNIQTTMWYRSNNGLSMVFDTYNSVGAVGTDNNGTAVNKYIPPMQAFWVRVSNDGDIASLTFKNSMRSHQTGNLLKSDTQNDIIRLKVSNGTNSDEAIVLFNSDATNAFDAFDSEKMSNNDASIPELYTVVNSQKLVINGLESAVSSPIIPLGFKTAKSGTFTISAKSIEGLDGVPVILEDKLLNISQDLTQTADYSFSSDSVDNASRFVLRLKSTTAANEVDTYVNIFAKTKAIAVTTTESVGKITVTDVLGRTITTQTIVSTQTEIEVPTGVYFVTVQTNDGLVTKQVVVE